MDFDANLNGDDQLNDVDEFVFGPGGDNSQAIENRQDSVLFVVDCNPSMIEPNNFNEGGVSNLQTVFKAAIGFMKTKIITSERDTLGIILYNVSPDAKAKKQEDSTLYTIMPIDEPNAEMIKKLEALERTINEDTKPSTEQTAISDVLWACQQEFKSYEKERSTNRIFLFTNDENPVRGNLNEASLARQKAKDLSEAEVDIDLFPMSRPKSDAAAFDIQTFYADILTLDEDEISDLTDLDNSHLKVLELSKRIRQKEFKKRTLGKCAFDVTPGMRVGFKFFNLVKQIKAPIAKHVNAANNNQLQSTTKFLCQTTGTELYPDQLGTSVTFNNGDKGAQKVNFTRDDMKKIKLGEPGMKLMGFKSRDSLKMYHNIRPSYFIYPDEGKVKGSGQLSSALINSLIKKNKYAHVKFVAREGASMRFAALLPQAEEVNEEDGFVTPPGFHVIFLPYAEDIRQPEEDPTVKKMIKKTEVKESQLKSAKLFIKNMTIDFDSNKFENPSIQKFYSGLQAFALNEEKPEEVEDTLEPDYEGMGKMEKVMARMKDSFFGGEVEDPAMPKPKVPGAGKRKKEEVKEEKKEPKVKKETKDSFNVTTNELKKLSNSGRLESKTVAWLKEALIERGVEAGRLRAKAKLVGLIEDWLDEQ